MKKIAFSEKYGLQDAVLERLKWMTRREVCQKAIIIDPITSEERVDMNQSPFKVGEIVAIAQRYEDIDSMYIKKGCYYLSDRYRAIYIFHAGWRNKMFVTANMMPHHIKVKAIRAERLQDISDEDCLKEGIYEDYNEHGGLYTTEFYDYKGNKGDGFATPREAYASLIDKISGKGTWIRNPWVWVYTFELVD